jgi:hypothetical protein
MKTVTYQISYCDDCPYFDSKNWETAYGVCKKMKRKRVTKTNPIPKWCPLPEAIETAFLDGWRAAQKAKRRVGTSTNSESDAITPLVVDAVNTDGCHHKQWYLEAIAEALQIALPPHDNGIAP